MLKMLTKPRRKQIHVGPQDDGKHMTLASFDRAVGQEGYLYELNKGVVEVMNIPHPRHFEHLQAVRNQLIIYQESHLDFVHWVAGSFDSKVMIDADESERHPDIAVYLTPRPETSEVWSIWVPTIAIEIVSESSIKRDYEEKPAEYLAFGIQEYWIVDGLSKLMKVQTRFGGRWKDRVVKPSRKYTTRHLPGFSLDLKRVFAAAK